jgi:head-tail adaptor
MKRTPTGKRNHRVMVISMQQVPDGMGGFTLTEQLEMTAWSRVRRMSGHEIMLAGALGNKQTCEAYIPASDAARRITTSMILHGVHSSMRWNIRDVFESEDRSEIILLCESGVPA